MLKNYKTDLIAIVTIFAIIGYGINLAMAAPTKATPVKKVEPAKKADKAAEPKKDPNRKKPTLKKKYQK